MLQEILINIGNEGLFQLFIKGGVIIYFLFAVAFLMLFIIVQKFLYIRFFKIFSFQKSDFFINQPIWIQENIKLNLINQIDFNLNKNVDFLSFLVKVASLLGLLGTIVGMIDVFELISNGQQELDFIAFGISKATIPTFVGMAISIVGLIFLYFIKREIHTKINKFRNTLS